MGANLAELGDRGDRGDLMVWLAVRVGDLVKVEVGPALRPCCWVEVLIGGGAYVTWC
jgi:hypothetical protein